MNNISDKENKNVSTTYDQYILSSLVTIALMFIGAAYFYSRIYKPLMNNINNPEMNIFEFIQELFYDSPNTDSAILKEMPDFKARCIFPEGAKINAVTGLVIDSSSESLVNLAEEIGISIPFSGAVDSIQ